ncbi:hypothetical protein [Massilia sp. BSC265]|uniref:hypothetical protein n=1 Tax=Massilia sp. BSC265 TaxID=1549812 RepID=UPI0004E964AF|nr:hypothetical protein [Massilia sp. BSC265]KFI09095.1 hypothetical protein JN27_00155 [Massilia sp. BSC265]
MSDQDKIVEFWNRRASGLNETEWTEFYRLLVPLLMRTRLPAEFADGAKRRDLVNIFFQDKVFLNAATTKAGPLLHAHALHAYFKRFALDLLSEPTATTSLDGLGSHEPAAPDIPAHERLLREAGIDIREAMLRADELLGKLDQAEAAYLAYNTCVESQDREPISSIARRMEIGTAFHFKARKLGITRSKGETYRGYGHTRIGRWLTDVGARLESDWREEIAALLVLLCERVRSQLRRAA